MKTVVASFDHIGAAKAAISDLVDVGFKRDDISFVSHGAAEYKDYFDADGNYTTDHEPDELTTSEGAASGAGIGATIGGIGGVLMGLGLLAVPGVGPALAAGPLASGLVGAGIGAASGGLAGALVNNGIPEEQAKYYAETVRRGGSVVTLTVDEVDAHKAEAALAKHDPVNIDERVRRWRDDGWTGYNPDADPYTNEQIAQERERYGIAGGYPFTVYPTQAV